jgi:hypothetical protein
VWAPVHGWSLLGYVAASVAAWVALFYILHRLPLRHKRILIAACTFLAGLFYTLEFFLPAHSRWLFFWGKHENPLSPLVGPLGNAVSVIYGFTIALGIISLASVHGKAIARRRSGWHNSAAFFAALVSMIVFGLWQSYVPDDPHRATWIFRASTVHRIYDVLFDGMYQPLGATVFSVLAFYIASAAYRAFRVRSGEAALMMAAAVVMMLSQVPVGQWLTHTLHGPWANLRVEVVANWLLTTLSSSALTGVGLGIAVGGLAMALRIWLGLERGSFFEAGGPK